MLASAPASADAAPLRAGAASFDITPPNGGTTLGYVRPDITVEGVHTRLTGRALVLDDGDTKVVLLATDLAFALEKDSRRRPRADLGFSHETSVHRHPHPRRSRRARRLAARAARARDPRGARRRVPARAAWGTREVPGVGRNRSIEAHLANHGIEQVYGQGRVEDDPLGVEHTLDTALRVLRVERPTAPRSRPGSNFPVHLTMSTPAVDVWDADVAAADAAPRGGDRRRRLPRPLHERQAPAT